MKKLKKTLAVIVMICMIQMSVLNNISLISYVDAASTGPIVTTSAGSATFTAGDNTISTPVTVDYGITISDPDNVTLASATVAMTGNFHAGEDVLSFVNDGVTMGNITASYNAGTGVMTLTSAGAVATLSQWQAALRAVTYTDTAVTPDTATRTISFVVNDGIKSSSAATRTVTITDVDQTPIVTTRGGSTAFIAGDNTVSTPVTVDSGITVSDLDNSTLSSATVAITGNFHSGEDVLSFVNTSAITFGNIVASYNSSTGVMTLTSAGATATLAQWQAALRAVTYTSSAVTPNNATRTISFVVNDGIKNSSAATRTVTITDVDQTPIVTTSGGSAAFTAGDNTTSTPVTVDSGITVSDLDNVTLASATVAITGNFHAGEDVLSYSNTSAVTYGNIVASYNSGTGVMTLTSAGATATLAQWQAALRAVTYTSSAVTPNTATRTISFVVNDGIKNSSAASRSVTITAADQTPIVTTSGGSTVFTAGDNTTSTPVTVDSGITVSDLDNGTLASATVAITGNFHAGEDVLSFVNDGATMGNITASYNASTGVLTLSSLGATATLAQWQAALRAVTYTSSAVMPNSATRTISFVVNDGIKNSSAASRSVTITAADQTPIVTTSGGSTVFTAGDNTTSTPVTVDSGITVSDPDNGTLASATVAITGNLQAGEDVLSFVNDGATMGNITASYDASTGVLTLSSLGASATLAQWQAALRTVTYTSTKVPPNTSTRTISFNVNDGTKTSATVTKSITITATNQTPVIQTSGHVASYISPAPPVVIDPGLTISDRDHLTLLSATVSITDHFHSAEDVLAFTNDGATMGDISANVDLGQGTLTLTSTGGATLAQWESALRAVTYVSTAAIPTKETRTIQFVVFDGTSSSAPVTSHVSVSQSIVLTGIDAGPNKVNLQVGKISSSVITATYSDLSTLDVTPYVTWNVAAPSIASVKDGIISGITAGTTVVSATYGGYTANIDVVITNVGNSNNGNHSSGDNSSTGGSTTTPTNPILKPDEPKEPVTQPNLFFSSMVNREKWVAALRQALASQQDLQLNDTAAHWAAQDISLASGLRWVTGYQDGAFKPNQQVTRAEFSALIVNIFGLTKGDKTVQLTDINDHWATSYIQILASQGLIQGYTDGTFQPQRTISRAEMLVILSKLINFQEIEPTITTQNFSDVPSDYWAKSIIDTAYSAKVIQGIGDNKFAPNKGVTRAEIITLILRALKLDPEIKALLDTV